MWVISTTFLNFPHFSPCEKGGRKAREISSCRKNWSQGSYFYFYFPLKKRNELTSSVPWWTILGYNILQFPFDFLFLSIDNIDGHCISVSATGRKVEKAPLKMQHLSSFSCQMIASFIFVKWRKAFDNWSMFESQNFAYSYVLRNRQENRN